MEPIDKQQGGVAGNHLPRIIQGGMGAGVSGWELAGAVAKTGELGVVSGTALEFIYARRLQNGDPGGHVRRAFSRFPVPEIAERVLDRYFTEGGKGPEERFKSLPFYTIAPSIALQELSVITNFAEVFLAKEACGGKGNIGINYLYKIQLPLLSSLYGALLAGVDYVLMGAGSPQPIPAILTSLARHADVTLAAKIQYANPSDGIALQFSPRNLMGSVLPTLTRPSFLAVVSSTDLAGHLAHTQPESPDGLIVEGPSAGGHNAPPRGPMRLDDEGQPIYGQLDDANLSEIAALGLPFWLAGSYGTPSLLRRALSVGAQGIQVGTPFAFCRESGLTSHLKESILRQVATGSSTVHTDPLASPTGFPFKVAQLPQTLSDAAVYERRQRICDIGCLRMPYKSADGSIGYRCPAEPERTWVRKGGRPPNAVGRKCLCNALLSNVGLGQVRNGGTAELPLLTAGNGLASIARYIRDGELSYQASDVIEYLRTNHRHRPHPIRTASKLTFSRSN